MYMNEFDKGFRFKKNIHTISSLLERINDGRLRIDLNFIYSKSWSRNTKSTFIESILLGMPISDIRCEEDNYGGLSVLDGTQRLLCLLEFSRDQFKLTDIKLRPELSGRVFSELPYRYTSSFFNRTEIELTIISYDTHPILKLEFLKRINSDSYRFPVQSARNYAFREHFYFLKELQSSCSHLLTIENLGFKSHTPSSIHRAASNFDELFLYLSSLVLTYHHEIPADKSDHEELLDAAANFIHDTPYRNQEIIREIQYNIKNIVMYFGKPITFNPQTTIARTWLTTNQNNHNIYLNTEQIASLFIASMKHEILDYQTVEKFLTNERTHRSINRTYQRIFD